MSSEGPRRFCRGRGGGVFFTEELGAPGGGQMWNSICFIEKYLISNYICHTVVFSDYDLCTNVVVSCHSLFSDFVIFFQIFTSKPFFFYTFCSKCFVRMKVICLYFIPHKHYLKKSENSKNCCFKVWYRIRSYFFCPKTLFVRTLGKIFTRIIFLRFFFSKSCFKYSFTLQKLFFYHFEEFKVAWVRYFEFLKMTEKQFLECERIFKTRFVKKKLPSSFLRTKFTTSSKTG